MVMRFNDSLLQSIGNLQLFVQGSLPITFEPLLKEERSEWVRATLVRFKYVVLLRLARISPAQVYRLRQHRRYREEALTIEKTKPRQTPIGERRKPEPAGAPGFLRVDTVHQGDFGKNKGVYHINLVDEVTQWEVIVAVEQISEECVEPALKAAFELFPFRIKK